MINFVYQWNYLRILFICQYFQNKFSINQLLTDVNKMKLRIYLYDKYVNFQFLSIFILNIYINLFEGVRF